MRKSHTERRSSLSEKQYVLGRRGKTGTGVLNIGRYYALDGSLGASVYLDALRPHMIFICGKRGYGKSYTIGVFLEEIAELDIAIQKNLAVVVLDTLGIFWSTQFPSKESVDEIIRWGRRPKGFPVRLLVPMRATKNYSKHDINVERFSLRIAELSPLHWCQLFDIKATDPVGVILTRAILALQSNSHHFSFAEILSCIQQDVRASDEVRCAVENFFIMADSWGVFDKEGLSIKDLVRPATITILDLSVLQSPILKDIVVALLSEKIFEERVKSRKIFEQKKMGFMVHEEGIPLVWLAVDEAQLFVPHEKKTLSKEVLIEEWMRQGRQPGLSLILATQRPSAVEPEVLSHCDIIICHRLTAQEDIDALGLIRPTYMHGDISESIKKIGSEKGVALLIDDTSESIHVVQLRPRVSWHGGAEPVIEEGKKNMRLSRWLCSAEDKQ
jgi:DNA helicase HerA-like ATPase